MTWPGMLSGMIVPPGARAWLAREPEARGKPQNGVLTALHARYAACLQVLLQPPLVCAMQPTT